MSEPVNDGSLISWRMVLVLHLSSLAGALWWAHGGWNDWRSMPWFLAAYWPALLLARRIEGRKRRVSITL